jgi:DNA-directed RNA polymerase specialized sigma24 family protein
MVRIVEDFWENYQEYQEQIISSILHITRRQFPNPDPQGEKEDINYVITELHRLNVFGKFDRKRLTSKTRSTRQQFENFLYQRIWAILYGEYGRRRKRTVRFRRVPAIEKAYDTNKSIDAIIAYEDRYLRDMKPNPDPAEEERIQHIRASRHPTRDDLGEIYSVIENTDHDTLIEETRQNILSACKNDKERKVIMMREEGYQNREIGEVLNMSGSNVAIILGRIKKRYETVN